MPPNSPNQPYDVLLAPKVFISYARADMNWALDLEQTLRAHGVNVWRDQDSIYGGQQWPKVVGEAIADCDAVLLLWSANSAASHFVEFEWTTALALKKTIIPCLLDETKLPPALAAINSIACHNANEAAPKILAALPREPQSREAERRAQVIAQLQQVTATEPAAALAQAKALFTQSNISVGGHFIQGGGDVQVTINEGRQHIPIFAIAFAVIAIIALAAFYFISRTGQPSSQPAPSPTVEEMSKLGGQVDNAYGNPVSGATVKVDEINGKPQMLTTTTGNGGFIIDKIPARNGVRVRVYISKEGYETHDQYVALPGPLNVKLRRTR
jgi:hypothetical protein